MTEEWKILVCGGRKSGSTATCNSIRVGKEVFANKCDVFDGFEGTLDRSYHCILVTISAKHIGKWKASCIEKLRNAFGERVYGHIVVAFTFVDALDQEEEMKGSSFELYVSSAASLDLRKLLEDQCNQRCVRLNNTACISSDRSENNEQMKHLSEVIQEVNYLNGGIIKQRLIVLGGSNAGKSSLCNLILDTDCFSVNKTTATSCAERNIEGMQVLVADTPAIPLQSSGNESSAIDCEISKSILMTSPGPRVVILVMKFDQSKEEVKKCMEYIRKYFGEDELSRILLVITYKRSLDDKEFKNHVLAKHELEVQRFLEKLKSKNNIIYYNEPSSDKDKKTTSSSILEKATSILTFEESRVTYVITGSRQVGKSCTRNSILDSKDLFQNDQDSSSLVVATRRLGSRMVTVVDTHESVESNIDEIKKYKVLQNSQPFFLVLVMKYYDNADIQEIPKKDQESIQMFSQHLPDLISKKLVIVFSNIDNAKEGLGPSTFENFLRRFSDQSKEVLRTCHYRCVAFDNFTSDRLVRKQQNDALFFYSDQLFRGNNMVRLVLFGVTGQGKSATANTIGGTGVHIFEESDSLFSATERCKSHVFEDTDQRYQVIDTPGLFDNRQNKTPTKTMLEISESMYLSAPGPHAFIMVSAIGPRFTGQHKSCFKFFKEIFGNSSCRHTIFVLSKIDRLVQMRMTLAEYLKSERQPEFNEFLRSCNGRILAIDNTARTGRERVREELMDIVGPMIAGHHGQHFTNKSYKDINNRIWFYGSGKALTARTLVENNKLTSLAVYSVFSVLLGAGVFSVGWLAVPGMLAYAAWSLGIGLWATLF